MPRQWIRQLNAELEAKQAKADTAARERDAERERFTAQLDAFWAVFTQELQAALLELAPTAAGTRLGLTYRLTEGEVHVEGRASGDGFQVSLNRESRYLRVSRPPRAEARTIALHVRGGDIVAEGNVSAPDLATTILRSWLRAKTGLGDSR
jgi:hypothetical protein